MPAHQGKASSATCCPTILPSGSAQSETRSRGYSRVAFKPPPAQQPNLASLDQQKMAGQSVAPPGPRQPVVPPGPQAAPVSVAPRNSAFALWNRRESLDGVNATNNGAEKKQERSTRSPSLSYENGAGASQRFGTQLTGNISPQQHFRRRHTVTESLAAVSTAPVTAAMPVNVAVTSVPSNPRKHVLLRTSQAPAPGKAANSPVVCSYNGQQDAGKVTSWKTINSAQPKQDSQRKTQECVKPNV